MNERKAQYIVATHGKLSQGYRDTIELLTKEKCVHAVTAYTNDEFPENLISLIKTFSKDETIVIFTDLLCGSVTQKIMELYALNTHIHVFAGVNLSLVLEVLLSNEVMNEEYCNQVVQSAKEQICYMHTAL